MSSAGFFSLCPLWENPLREKKLLRHSVFIEQAGQMRTYFIFIMIFFNIAVKPVGAADMLLGTVASVDRETGEIVLQLDELPDKTAYPAQSKTITVKISPDHIPECVAIGKTVRVWGEYINGGGPVFQAEHIRGGGFGRGMNADPTGVRSRLGRGRGGHNGGRGGGGGGGGGGGRR